VKTEIRGLIKISGLINSLTLRKTRKLASAPHISLAARLPLPIFHPVLITTATVYILAACSSLLSSSRSGTLPYPFSRQPPTRPYARRRKPCAHPPQPPSQLDSVPFSPTHPSSGLPLVRPSSGPASASPLRRHYFGEHLRRPKLIRTLNSKTHQKQEKKNTN
jgi:hypothetical protein